MSKDSHSNILKAKFQIGSIHGRLNYSPNGKAFHHSDVPEAVSLLRRIM